MHFCLTLIVDIVMQLQCHKVLACGIEPRKPDLTCLTNSHISNNMRSTRILPNNVTWAKYLTELVNLDGGVGFTLNLTWKPDQTFLEKEIKSPLLAKSHWSSQKLTGHRTVVTKGGPLNSSIGVTWDGDQTPCRKGLAMHVLTSPVRRGTADIGVITMGDLSIGVHSFTHSKKYYKRHLLWAKHYSRNWR